MARKYSMRCSIARTLDIVGDRWTILILRDLFVHPTRRFLDFEASLPGLTSSVLSARIKELTAHGILTSRLYAEHPPRPEYLLTPKGRALNPILIAMKAWESSMPPVLPEPPAWRATCAPTKPVSRVRCRVPHLRPGAPSSAGFRFSAKGGKART